MNPGSLVAAAVRRRAEEQGEGPVRIEMRLCERRTWRICATPSCGNRVHPCVPPEIQTCPYCRMRARKRRWQRRRREARR